MKTFILKIGRTEIRNILSIVCVLGVFALAFLLCFKDIPVGNKDLVFMYFGQMLSVGFALVMGYNFGSSKNESDAAKNDITKVETETKTI